MGFLKFIIIFFFVSYLLSLLFRFLIKRFFKKVQKNFREKTQEYDDINKKEGDVSVDYVPKSHSKIDNGDDEYIEFEEVDE